MLSIGCIADDFTGAGDIASFFKKGGLKTVYLNGDALDKYCPGPDVDAVVVALKCRSIPTQEAVSQSEKVCCQLLDWGARHIYYKYCSTFDSTDQGNIGPITDNLMELLDTAYTILCPALPVNGRVVKDGILYVNGVPLAESPMKDHPLNPMRLSYLPELMQRQSRYPCISLSRQELYGDRERLFSSLRERGLRGRFTAAVDYQEDADGARLAELFGTLPLLTGGSGLAEHLGRLYADGAKEEKGGFAQNAAGRGRLLLAGSCSAMTNRQVARYLSAGKQACQLRPYELLSGRQRFEELEALLVEAEGDILFFSTEEPEQVRRNQAFGAEKVARLLESLMGRLALSARQNGYTRLVVAGGETSGAVMHALGYQAYEIFESVAPGVPRMVPVEEPKLSLVLKSGNFGGEDFLLTALA